LASPGKTLNAVDALFIGTGTIHVASNIFNVTMSELASYVVEQANPLVQAIGPARLR
jgi:hypothetical protein